MMHLLLALLRSWVLIALPPLLMLLPALWHPSQAQTLILAEKTLAERGEEPRADEAETDAQEEKDTEDSIALYTTPEGHHVTDIRTNQGRTAYKEIQEPSGRLIVSHSARSRKPPAAPDTTVVISGWPAPTQPATTPQDTTQQAPTPPAPPIAP
jgi:hypothetical protein